MVLPIADTTTTRCGCSARVAQIRSATAQIFSGVASGLSDAQLEPFIANMHTALWVLAATSVVGAVVCLLRPAHVREEEDA